MTHAEEVAAGRRFEFGRNWSEFLETLDEDRVRRAEDSLRRFLGCDHLRGRTFLDAGSGSGLFSLAAARLGARVTSFDYDPRSVACTRELKARHAPEDAAWTVEEGSVLDAAFLERLGRFDVVYSWGVLHHTGRMWDALAFVVDRVGPRGQLFVAIYNDQGRASRAWLAVKRAYCALPRPLRFLVLWPSFVRLWGPTLLRDAIRLRPLASWRAYRRERGMSPWRDVVDWVGGLPFEVARPEAIFEAVRARGFTLERLATEAMGCNQYVFRRDE